MRCVRSRSVAVCFCLARLQWRGAIDCSDALYSVGLCDSYEQPTCSRCRSEKVQCCGRRPPDSTQWYAIVWYVMFFWSKESLRMVIILCDVFWEWWWLIAVYNNFVNQKVNVAGWCKQHYVHHRNLVRATEIRAQLRRYDLYCDHYIVVNAGQLYAPIWFAIGI